MVDEGENSHFTDVDGNPPSPTDQALEHGTDVNGYIVDGILGKGGMGVVYSATHAVIGKRAAIKVLRAEVSMSATTIERFVQEARAVNKIGHPNIIDIFDYGNLPDGRAFHLMDLLVGESLRQRLRRGHLHPSEAANVIDGITSALIAAHDKGFVHRDLKPDNVFLSAKDEGWPDIKLLDFGLAKLMPDMGQAAFITKTGVMIGTPEYMSPEQARGLPVDYRTDVYALGVLMFEILSGERPFPTVSDSFAMLQYHAEEPPPSIASMVRGLPEEMVQLVDSMLSKEPAARPSLAAVRTVIRRLRSMKLPTKSVAGLELASFSNPGMSASRLGAEPILPTQSLPTRQSAPSLKDPEEPVFDDDMLATKPRRQVSAPATQPGQASGLAGTSAPMYAATTLGVPPPPKPVPSQRIPVAQASSASRGKLWFVFAALLALAAGAVLALVLLR